MIDYFRNGKYQLLFSGRNYLHLLDRNGNYVERYPVKLRSPASNALALFDYDNNRNYRLLIAGEDRIIYTYDRTGSAVKGWNPFRTGSLVSSEVSWFRVSGKDFLVVSDENSVYFLDRTGNKRLTLKEPVTKAAGSTMRLASGRTPSVVCTSPGGTVQHIYFDGTVEKFTPGNFTTAHSFDIFDVDGDGSDEYIFIDKGILYLYDNNMSEVFSKQFGSDGLGGPINFVFSSTDRKIGVFEPDRKLIYLIDSNGNSMEGFPLRGASMFSVGKLSDDGGWHLIVGGTDRFLYNYKLGTALR
jgi:WD40 repeat protein